MLKKSWGREIEREKRQKGLTTSLDRQIIHRDLDIAMQLRLLERARQLPYDTPRHMTDDDDDVDDDFACFSSCKKRNVSVSLSENDNICILFLAYTYYSYDIFCVLLSLLSATTTLLEVI